MSFKKNPTIEELQKEVELLQEQVITGSAQNKALAKALKNHPAQIELDFLKSKWWYKFFKFLGL